jgi:hypothetical protein
MQAQFNSETSQIPCRQQYRNETYNDRIYSRNIPSGNMEAKFSPVPVSTKYSIMPVFDQYKQANIPIVTRGFYNVGKTFSPGNAEGPWSGFASNVDVETILRNQQFGLQYCEQSVYVPSSNSDLYRVEVVGRQEVQNHPALFNQEQFAPFNPNTLNLGTDIFNNSTRQQLKDLN